MGGRAYFPRQTTHKILNMIGKKQIERNKNKHLVTTIKKKIKFILK